MYFSLLSLSAVWWFLPTLPTRMWFTTHSLNIVLRRKHRGDTDFRRWRFLNRFRSPILNWTQHTSPSHFLARLCSVPDQQRTQQSSCPQSWWASGSEWGRPVTFADRVLEEVTGEKPGRHLESSKLESSNTTSWTVVSVVGRLFNFPIGGTGIGPCQQKGTACTQQETLLAESRVQTAVS